MSDVTTHLEQFWLRWEVPGNRYLVLGIIYRPPAGSMKCFMDELKCSFEIICDLSGSHEGLWGILI